ncbi:hypothetical protein L2E82_49787 [Cichorium intybus]|uniref:Uncharacterized protein n=1 Tax=Cichorium intybus TaxID=13427 RepID=A0ACB8Z246_CICIN|nr:hypothetical protein L2E82_49787 [Cichorium intybus]
MEMEDCCYGWRWRAAAMAGNGGLLLWPEMKPPTFAVAGHGGLRDMRLFTSGEAWEAANFDRVHEPMSEGDWLHASYSLTSNTYNN